MRNLKVLKVDRYRSSGKLVASGLGNGHVIPLNSDLTFSEKQLHRVRRDTELDPTPYRVEVELGSEGNCDTYRIIRTWNEHPLPPKSSDPSALVEHRIDISPSEHFSETENRYVGQSAGHPIGGVLTGISFFLVIPSVFYVYKLGILASLPFVVSFVAGGLIFWLTRTPGNTRKIQEVKAAKERLRGQTKDLLQEAMHNVRTWAALDGIGFENAVAKVYEEKGYVVECTPRTNDQGVDLILKRNGATAIVQCKAYTDNVGVSAIRELAGVRASWPHAEEVILVALYDFSNSAKDFAAQQNIKLFSVTRDYLGTDYRPGR